MPSQPLTPEAATALAQAAGVTLDDAAAARVTRAIAPTSARLAQGDIAVPFETEPATFLAVARRGARR